MKLFHFFRSEDHSGVSGTGPVVEGVQFSNGWCALRWMSGMSSICFYQSIDDVRAIHGHGGKTELVIQEIEAYSPSNSAMSGPHTELFLNILESVSELVTTVDELERPEVLRDRALEVKVMIDELVERLIEVRQRAA
jgi:hypothetical protein